MCSTTWRQASPTEDSPGALGLPGARSCLSQSIILIIPATEQRDPRENPREMCDSVSMYVSQMSQIAFSDARRIRLGGQSEFGQR